MFDKKELKAKQQYEQVVKKVQETEEKLFVLREKKRQLATKIHYKFHEHDRIAIAGN